MIARRLQDSQTGFVHDAMSISRLDGYCPCPIPFAHFYKTTKKNWEHDARASPLHAFPKTKFEKTYNIL